MNETGKTTNKKIIFYILGAVVAIALVVCFIIALNNHKSNKTETNTKKTTTTLSSNTITKGGSYNITGENSCIVINTTESVELDLDGATITCDSGPAINIEEADDVTIVLKGENTITSTTTEDLDGAIYSKSDLILKGEGSLKVTSNYDGIVSKDDLIINSGTYTIDASDDAIRGKDSVEITDGTFTITSGGDGIKTTNEEDTKKGYININGGTFTINSTTDGIDAQTNLTIKDGKFTINSKDDAIHANGMIEITDGTFDITAAEGIEATYVKIDGGEINISASDDGINAGNKSTEYSVKVEINGGNITIKMGQGDTDGVDSNGDIIINGGTISVTGQSIFDYDGTGTINGGKVICNGEEVTTLPNQIMGGGQGGMQPGNEGMMPSGNRQRMR